MAHYDLEGLEEAIQCFRYLALINLFYNNSKHDLQPVLALLNRLLVWSNKKNLFSARFKSLYQTLVSKFEVDACSKINFGNVEQNLGKVKPIKAFVLQDSNLPTKPWYS